MGFTRGDGEFIASTFLGFMSQEEEDRIRRVAFWPAQRVWNGIRRITNRRKDSELPTTNPGQIYKLV